MIVHIFSLRCVALNIHKCQLNAQTLNTQNFKTQKYKAHAAAASLSFKTSPSWKALCWIWGGGGCSRKHASPCNHPNQAQLLPCTIRPRQFSVNFESPLQLIKCVDVQFGACLSAIATLFHTPERAHTPYITKETLQKIVNNKLCCVKYSSKALPPICNVLSKGTRNYTPFKK